MSAKVLIHFKEMLTGCGKSKNQKKKTKKKTRCALIYILIKLLNRQHILTLKKKKTFMYHTNRVSYKWTISVRHQKFQVFFFSFFKPVPLIHPQLFYFCSVGFTIYIKHLHSSQKLCYG